MPGDPPFSLIKKPFGPDCASPHSEAICGDLSGLAGSIGPHFMSAAAMFLSSCAGNAGAAASTVAAMGSAASAGVTAALPGALPVVAPVSLSFFLQPALAASTSAIAI